MRQLQLGKHLRNIAILAFVIGALFWLLFVLPEQLWWAQHKDRKLVVAVYLTRQRLIDLDWGEHASLRSDQQLSKNIAHIRKACSYLGHPVARVS
jgi:hypothetical protein